VPLAALDEAHVESFLKRPELLGDGALGDGIERAGLGKTAGLDKIAKDFEGIDIHARAGRRKASLFACQTP